MALQNSSSRSSFTSWWRRVSPKRSNARRKSSSARVRRCTRFWKRSFGDHPSAAQPRADLASSGQSRRSSRCWSRARPSVFIRSSARRSTPTSTAIRWRYTCHCRSKHSSRRVCSCCRRTTFSSRPTSPAGRRAQPGHRAGVLLRHQGAGQLPHGRHQDPATSHDDRRGRAGRRARQGGIGSRR